MFAVLYLCCLDSIQEPALSPVDLQVKIMKEWDPSGKLGPKVPLPDIVKIHEPKENEEYGFDDAKEFGKDKLKEEGYYDSKAEAAPLA